MEIWGNVLLGAIYDDLEDFKTLKGRKVDFLAFRS